MAPVALTVMGATLTMVVTLAVMGATLTMVVKLAVIGATRLLQRGAYRTRNSPFKITARRRRT
eukprot:6130277-Pleurochrysis_carterae.AAC.1